MSDSNQATLVKQAVDIVDVIGQVVTLRRTGNRYVGLCPFHQEKTPSFHVDAENQLYYCFGCGSGGDVLNFVMRYQNRSFSETLTYLADRYHVTLPQTAQLSPGGGNDRLARQEREALWRVLSLAGDFFYRQLHHSAAGAEAREYLQRRALPETVIETERLGYAPDAWDGLLRQLRNAEVDLDLGVKAGLLGKSAQQRYYDRFRNRLIFPIVDENRRVVAFGGRSLTGTAPGSADGSSPNPAYDPKYLNSPETEVYHKGRMLYQLARAREACRQVRQVVLVEGYMDLLAFHAQGFHRVVATLGTALTIQQVRLLRRFADEVILAYDGDEAGEKAMLRALPLVLQEQLAASCIRFPAGQDPDDFLRAEGMPGFERLLAERQELGVYAIRKALQQWDGTTAGKTAVVEELQPVVGAVRQPVLQAEYLRLIADRLELSESVILRQLQYLARQPQGRSDHPAPVSMRQPPAVESRMGLEEKILRTMIKYPALIEELESAGTLDQFQNLPLRTMAEVLMEMPHPPRGTFDAAAIHDAMPSPELRTLFTRFLLESPDLSQARVQLDDWLKALGERQNRHTLTHLREALHQAEQDGNSVRVRDILAQIQSLCAGKKRLKETPDNA